MSTEAKKKKFLVVKHFNGKQHLVQPGLKKTLEYQNTLKPFDKRLTFEERELTEEEAANFPPVDPTHKPLAASEAAELREENETLKEQLRKLQTIAAQQSKEQDGEQADKPKKNKAAKAE